MDRPAFLCQTEHRLTISPVVALLGPRQCGKTTLARMVAERCADEVTRFDLEDPTDLAALSVPRLTLQDLRGLVVIDEIQRLPDLFPVLRVLVDRPDNPARFLILGSASRDLIRQSSETLAGRISYIEMTPFTLDEVGIDARDRLWLRGGFPRSFLAASEADSRQWRKDYIATFLERDLPALGITIAPQSLRRFWMMLAHYHGQILNYSELGRSFGVADTTVRRYLDILSATFMIRLLAPWHENVGKRQVKAPKLFVRDAGLFHRLMAIADMKALRAHPKLGASWEGFALEEIIHSHRAMPEETYFWAAHGGGEVDLLLMTEQGRVGFEVKYTDQPKVSRSMHTAMEVLQLDSLTVVYPGERAFPLAEKIRAVGLNALMAETAAASIHSNSRFSSA
jgi:predicted AAA+ superfamily ATPase